MFRAAILFDMEEGMKEEMFVKDFDEKTLSTVIHFVYLSELEMTDDQDVQKLILAADMYDLPGLRALLCLKMDKKDLSGEILADLLISANRHGAKDLREVAYKKIRAKRELCKEEGFRKKMKKADQSIMIDLFNDL